MQNKEELAAEVVINRLNECGLLIDQFLNFYDELIKRKFPKERAAEVAERVISSFMMYKAGLIIDEEISNSSQD